MRLHFNVAILVIDYTEYKWLDFKILFKSDECVCLRFFLMYILHVLHTDNWEKAFS